MRMADSLAAFMPPLPPGMEQTESGLIAPVSDLERILALPRRPPVNCDRDSRTKLLAPETQALVEVMTERFARPKRATCACRPRRISLRSDGMLSIQRILPENEPAEDPLTISFEAFAADHRANSFEAETVRTVRNLRPGDNVLLPAADGGQGHPCITTLNAIQSWMLREAPRVGGALGFIAVGAGKTALGILTPLAFTDCKLAVILAEPSQRTHYRAFYLRMREHFRVPSMVFDDQLAGFTVPGTPPLHFLPYSKLSHPSSTDLLDRLNPDVIIADEAHRVAAVSSRTRRVLRFLTAKIAQRERDLREGKPVMDRAVRFVAWSGTLESRSIRDTQHLAAHALGTGSPLPLDPEVANEWSAVIDPSNQPDRSSPTAKSLQRAFIGREIDSTTLVEILTGSGESKLRSGYCKRRTETPGIISTTSSSIGAALYMSLRPTPKMPEAIKKALTMVRAGERPDGDLLVDQSEIVRCVRDVASGYFYYWKFDPKTPDSLIEEWFRRRKLWAKELRAKLQRAEVHLDSPLLCTNAAIRYWAKEKYTGELPVWASETWPAWAEIKDQVPHEARVQWIGDGTPEAADPNTHPGYYLARDAAKWAKDNLGVVWYLSDPFGRKVAELAGLPCHGGGPDAEKNILSEKGNRSIVASIIAHGAGRDGLQRLFSTQLITQMSSSNLRIEQLLGRLHREGQKADAITTQIYLPVAETTEAFRKVLAQAEFNYAMTGNEQKILLCDRDFDV